MKGAILTLFIYCLTLPFSAISQEETTTVYQGKRYLDLKINSLDKYNARLEQHQSRLLKKLKRKEARLATKLKAQDSAAYAKYKQQSPSYDSIGKLQDADSATKTSKTKWAKNAAVDSLKGITNFLQSQSDAADAAQLQGYAPEINKLKTDLNYRSYINGLIDQRANFLKSLTTNSNIPVLTSIQKNVFYEKQKMNMFKQMEEEPTKAEEKVLEYLEGTEGFDKAINKAAAWPNSMQHMTGNESASDLTKMGFQTKQGLESSLQQKFGSDNMGAISQNMGKQVGQWQDQMNGLKTAISNAKQTKQNLQQLAHTQKPSFKINPMRGLPFWKRIEKQYNWQTTRATIDGQPAMLQMSAMAGFKQNPKLTYGLGLATEIGLGQNWNNVHISFQRLGLRSFVEWKWQYGIGLYAGYERMYKQAVFVNNPEATTSTDLVQTVHNTNNYNESILIGLTKRYNLNSKYNGAIQVLYDIWWQEKGLRSPIVLRFSTMTK